MGRPAFNLKVPKAILHDSIPRRSLTEDDTEALARRNAAIRIQRAWRARKRASYPGADCFCTDLIMHAQQLKVPPQTGTSVMSIRLRFLCTYLESQMEREVAKIDRNIARERWHRAIFLALKLQDGNQMLADDGVHVVKAARKYLEAQYWLEMVDSKHRYGVNLKHYHRRWQQDDTTDNFFKWLDQGVGMNVSLKECPREQLERERVSYLSSSQRLNYLVRIDHEGKLRWAKSGELVDTTPGTWKDSGDGTGVVPIQYGHSPRASFKRQTSLETAPSHTTSDSFSEEEEPEPQIHYYLGPQSTGSHIKSWLWRNFTPHGLLDRLLRKTLLNNTWIYVADKNFNIFIGIKTPGTFQHSSFLGGGLVTSAGLITVKDGVVQKLSPLSGHYRTSVQHFRNSLKIMEQHGIDMHKVERSKAELVLWVLEHFAKFKKKQAKLAKVSKQKVGNTFGTVCSTLGRRSCSDHAPRERKR